MASSLYQNAGPGRPPPPPGTYRQNQPPPPPPPGQYGAPNPYNYAAGPPSPYAAAGPHRPVTYNPTYVYGSPPPSYGPPGVPSQSQYPPLPPYPLPPPPPLPSAPAPPPPHPTQPPHHRLSFSSTPNTTSQPHQAAMHTPYYPSSLPPLPSQLPPPPPPPTSHLSSSQASSHGNFMSSLPKQQSLPPPPPLPVPDTLKDTLNSSLPPPPPISNMSSTQPAQLPTVVPRQNAAQVPAQNNWISGGEGSGVGAAQANWSSGREANNLGSTQGAWNLPPSQTLAYPASMQGVASSQGITTGVMPADFSTVAKTGKTVAVSKSSLPGTAPKADNRFESEQEHRERKKREYERKKLEEKREKDMQSGSTVHKSQPTATPVAKYASAAGSRDSRSERKTGTSTDKVENRLKRPSTFLCKIKFRNELPDPVSQPKLIQVNNDKDRYSKYTITSLEKTQKHKLLVDPDLGIPLDLLDISVYNAPKVKPPMDPADEELLRDDEKVPSAKTENIRKKDRPTDKGVAWLVKTQYISPISLDPAKQPLTERQAKELKEMREGTRDFLEALNDREQQIHSIEESFRAAKQKPVHQTKPGLEPVEIFPLLPDFERWGDQLVHVIFDGEPTADSELHSKLDPTVRDDVEARAIMKSFVLPATETSKSEKFLAYMVPKLEELGRDIYNEDDEISYTWMREYHWDVRPDENVATYVFTFGEDSVQYLPLRTKLTLQKKRAKEGRSKDEAESYYAVPSSVTVHRRELTQEEEEEREAQRQALTEGLTPAALSSHHVKRRQSDEAELPASKRRVGNKRDLSDEDEEVSM